MKRSIQLFSFIFLALTATACGGYDHDGDAGGGATVIGTFQAGLQEDDPAVRIEDQLEVHEVDPDDDEFVADDLAPGDITIIIETDDLRGEITVRDTLPGEVVEVSVREEGGSLVIRIERRVPRADDDHHHHDDDIVLSAHHIDHKMRAGVHDGDLIITGHHIKVKGKGCSTIINGDLIIEGHHIDVKDLHVRGEVWIADGAHHVKVKQTDHCHDHDHHDHHDHHDDHHDHHDD